MINNKNNYKMCRQASTTFILFLLLVCSVLLLVPTSEAASESESESKSNADDRRPRIGLVLGGGGARGAAHVGVLKVLEELRIPVDVVVGTSMGSIVAGLYASGLTPEEIEQEMLSQDWNDLFQDNPAREDRSFRRKRDDALYTSKASVGFNDGNIQIPLAYIRGQKFDLLLNRLTLPVVGVKDFNQLPIPFRAVATDLETGKEVVLAHGSLTKAIRASMAVPAAFDPVKIDGRLLIDGGIANNVPVSVARELGAEVFIVVDVGSGLLSGDNIRSALDVSGQLANFLFTLNTEAQLKTLTSRDVLINPPLGDISGGDFGRIAEAIPTGVQGANQVIDALRRYSLNAEQYVALRAKQRHQQASLPVINFVRIDNQSHLDDAVIAERISARPGETLDVEQLERDIGQIYGLEIFESVRYDLVQEGDKTGLIIQAMEKSWGPGYFQFGLSVSNSHQGDVTTKLGMVYTLTEINDLNGEWRTGVQLGDEPAIFTELHQPLDALSRYFASGKIGYAKQNINVLDDVGNRLARYQLKLSGFELGIGREFGTWGEGRLGYRRQTGTAEINIGAPAPDVDADIGEFFLKLSDDRLDSLYFPRVGHYGVLEYRAARERYGANSDYDQWVVNYTHAFSWGQNTVIGALSGAITEDDNAPLVALYEMGGAFRLSGLQEDQLSGQRAGLIELIYMRSLSEVGFFQLFKSYAGISLEMGNVWQTSADVSVDNTINAGSLFLGFDTPIGPLYLVYGRTDTNEQAAYIYLGPRFTL